MFGKRSPSFKSLLQLCDRTQGGVELNKLCMKFVSSSLIVRRIMESRCKMGTKLQMVKFVEKLRSNIKYGRIFKWKDQRDIWLIVSYSCITALSFLCCTRQEYHRNVFDFQYKDINFNQIIFFSYDKVMREWEV